MDTETPDLIDVELPDTDAPAPDPKEANRKGFEQRQTQKRLEELSRELEGYKRREEEARKATLTETQRLKEELDGLKAERQQEAAQRLREKVARDYKLPDAFVNRLVGGDEESLRADAEELAKVLPRQRVGTISDPVKDAPNPGRTFRASDLSNRAYYLAHKAEIELAAREGRITND